MTDAWVLAVGLLAEDAPRDTGPDFGKASPFGLVVIVILLLCTFLLVWSMNKHLKKLPESFDREHPEPDQAVDEGTVGQPGDTDTDTDAAPAGRGDGAG